MLRLKLFLLFVLLLTLDVSWAQTVKVKSEESLISGEKVTGYAVDLEGKPEEINNSFTKYLKLMGKVRQNESVLIVNEPTINGTGYKTPVYGKAKERGVWIGIKKSDWNQSYDNINKELEKFLYDFGVKFYRDKVQSQIDESTQAQTAVEKQQQRLVAQNKSLNTSLEFNKNEKLRLEKAVAANAKEYEKLQLEIEKNKHDQDSLLIVNEQVKKVVEAHKERQRKVN